MDRLDFLKNQLDYVQARIEEIDEKVINGNQGDKGYKEVIDSYNKWVDQYNVLLEKIDHVNDIDIDIAKLELDKERLQIEQEIEQEKNNLKAEEIRLEREKFAYDVEHQKKQDTVNEIFEVLEITGKLLVPIAGLTGVIYVANLAYMNDSKLELCNGRIMGGVKDLLKIMAMKV